MTDQGITPRLSPDSPDSGTGKSLLDDPLIGTVLSQRFSVEKLIGTGGWGNVYIGRHLTLDTDIAVKTLHLHFARDEQCRQRLEQEAKILGRVDSQYVVKTIDYGLDPVPFLVMEYFDGIPLSDHLRLHGYFSQQDSIKLFEQLCSGLKAAHAIGLVHRDLKPSNILINKEGELKAKIVDFGIAKLTDTASDKITKTGEVMGSPPYMAPEQWSGSAIDQRTDIYALGCVMYEVLTGAPAFLASQPFEYLNLHMTADPKPISPSLKISKNLELVVLKCLEKDAERRYANTAQISEDLGKLKSGQKVKIRLSRSKGPAKRSAIIYGAAAALVFSLCGLLFWQKDPLLSQYCQQLNDEADRLAKTGETEKAVSKFRQSLLAAEYLPRQAKVHLHALSALSKLLRSRGAFGEAGQLEKTYSQLIAEPQVFPEITKKIAAANHAMENGKLDLAQNVDLELLEITQKIGVHTLVHSAILNNLSEVKRLKGDYRDALEKEQESLRIAEELLEPDDYRIAIRLNNLGRILRKLGRHDQAIQTFLHAAEINKKSKRPEIVSSYNNLAAVYVDQRKYKEAIDTFQFAYQLSGQFYGGKDIGILNNIGCAYMRQGDYQKAVDTFKTAINAAHDRGTKSSPLVRHILANLAESYSNMKDYKHAKETLETLRSFGSDIQAQNMVKLEHRINDLERLINASRAQTIKQGN